MTDWPGLDIGQTEFLHEHLADPELIDDMSWGQVDTVVLHVRADGEDVVVKAAGPDNHHIGREITAHQTATSPLVQRGASARLVASDRHLNVLITTYLPGTLVEGSGGELSPAVHEQAGAILRALHDQGSRIDEVHERDATAKALAWLDRAHRIAPDSEARARGILNRYDPRPIAVVPTHGDWQPRNWLIDGDRVRVIDFGRFAHRPAATDLCRLAVQQWRLDPQLERAFLAGYGSDPRDDDIWPIDLLREAIGTAVWAYQVGDEPFERQGHRMLAEAIARF